MIRSILSRLLLANLITKLLPGNLQVKNVKTLRLTLGNSSFPLHNSPKFVLGKPNNRQKGYSFQVTKQQKSRLALYEIFLNLQHYFAADALTPISNLTLVSSAALYFSNNISIFGSGSKNDKWLY